MARPFDGAGQAPLVFGAEAGASRRHNLGLRRHKTAQGLNVFIVNPRNVFGTKVAGISHTVFAN